MIISEIIPTLDKIWSETGDPEVRAASRTERDFINQLKVEFERVIDLKDLKKDKLIVLATLLDPRFKDLYFEREQIDLIKPMISFSEPPEPSAKKICYPNDSRAQLIEMKSKSSIDVPLNSDVEIAELSAYLNQPPQPMDSCPIEYWKVTMARFPNLAKAFHSVCTLLATQVESERLFSSGGLIFQIE